MAEDVKIYVSETVERVEIKVSDPFPTNVLPTGTLEINDIKANTLSSVESGGSIPAEIYSWFKSKFTSLVDKLVSSWIHGLLFVTKTIDETLTSLQTTVGEHSTSLVEIDGRLDAIEDKLIVSYIVPVDAASVVIDKDRHGNPLNLTDGRYEISRCSFVGCNAGIANPSSIYVNNIDLVGAFIQTSIIAGYNGINIRGGTRYTYSIVNLQLSDGVVYFDAVSIGANNETTASSRNNLQGFSVKSVVTINTIASLVFKDLLGSVNIKAGTVITIKRL